MNILCREPPSFTCGFGYSLISVVTFSNSSTFGVDSMIFSSFGVVTLTSSTIGFFGEDKISIIFTIIILLSSAIFLISSKIAVISSGVLSSVPSMKIVITNFSLVSPLSTISFNTVTA